ncbi:MAG TPA: efflux RND transporter periplasmic adaptor subunit [Terracidiphilus sp.]|nr:efflux RND transporter periplasmic adaptor subunit [Terracidiphilus sp.]
MARERKELDRRWLWIGAALVLVAVFFTVRELARPKLPIHIAQAERETLSSTLSTNGHVEPEVNYAFPSPIAGIIKAVYVQQGDKVPAGKLLLSLDDTEARARLATAVSAVKAAQASLEAAEHNGTLEQRQASAADITRAQLDRDQAQRNLDALTKLNASGAASAGEVAAARQQLQTAEATLSAAQQSAKTRYSPAEMARAQAALTDAEANAAAARAVLDQTQMRAPIAGTVYSVDASATEFTEEGKVLLQMADLHHERVRAYFDEPEIGRLAVGQPIEVKWDAKPGKMWHGHIVRTPVTVTTYGTRTVGEVLVALDDADGELLPQTDVTVTVTIASEPDVLSVPREALYTENGKPYVFKLAKNGSGLVKTPVTIGTLNLTQVSILSGLNEGDSVATGTTTGQPLQTGIPVKVVE